MTRRSSNRVQRPRLSRCGRGCRRIDVDEMIYTHPEKLKQKRRQAA